MNNYNCDSSYVCAGSGCKQACKRHDIGTQCGATAINITAKTIKDNQVKDNQQNQQNSQKNLRQLEVVPSTADGFPDDLEGYVEPDPCQNQPAAFVPSTVPKWRTPPFMNIYICVPGCTAPQHHITPT